MKPIILATFLLMTPAISFAATPKMYINIGDCVSKNDPDVSFRVMVDGNSNDQKQDGLIIYKEIPSPADEKETLTLALSTTLDKNADGSYQFINGLLSETVTFTLVPGAKTSTVIGDAEIICVGNK